MQGVAGGPSPSEIARNGAAVKAAQAGPSYKTVVVGDHLNEQTGLYEQRDNEFAVTPFPNMPYDNHFNIKQDFAANTEIGGTKNWVVPFTDKDASYFAQKRDASEQADYDQWVARKYDLTDPAQLSLLLGIDPEYAKRREQVIDYQVKVSQDYAKLRLRGVKTKAELQFEWLVETGRIELPKGPIWDPRAQAIAQGMVNANGTINARVMTKRYRAGYFSPVRFLTSFGWNADVDNRADVRGVERNAMMGPAGGGTDANPISWLPQFAQ